MNNYQGMGMCIGRLIITLSWNPWKLRVKRYKGKMTSIKGYLRRWYGAYL